MAEEENKEENKEETENKENLKDKVEHLDNELYEKRKAELKEIENRVDKKVKDLREIVDDAERQGVTNAGQKQEKKTPEQEKFDGEIQKIQGSVGR